MDSKSSSTPASSIPPSSDDVLSSSSVESPSGWKECSSSVFPMFASIVEQEMPDYDEWTR